MGKQQTNWMRYLNVLLERPHLYPKAGQAARVQAIRNRFAAHGTLSKQNRDFLHRMSNKNADLKALRPRSGRTGVPVVKKATKAAAPRSP